MTYVEKERVVHPPVDGAARDVYHECIEECFNCHAVCITTVQHCLASGGELADSSLVSVLIDCAEMAQVNASFMLRGSAYAMVTAAACAELCRSAEEACRALSDERLARCADAVASCADSCERVEEPAIV